MIKGRVFVYARSYLIMSHPTVGIICSTISDFSVKTPGETISFIFKYGHYPWRYIIIVILVIFVFWEFSTRWQGRKSVNGFSRKFNVLVGSVVYMLNLWLVGYLISLFIGDSAACIPESVGSYFVAFFLTKKELRIIGFWVY